MSYIVAKVHLGALYESARNRSEGESLWKLFESRSLVCEKANASLWGRVKRVRAVVVGVKYSEVELKVSIQISYSIWLVK